MKKLNLGAWLGIIGIIMLITALVLHLFCYPHSSLIEGIWLDMVILFLVILGLIYIVIGALVWKKKNKPDQIII